jgi:lipoprotein-releasing system permease protein
LGILICYLQQTYKLINFEGNFVTDSIPVNIETMDVFLIFCTVMAIGLIAAWIPIRKISLPAINPAQAN